MLDTSKLTKEELDLIQDALTHYEQRNAGQDQKWRQMMSITNCFENAARKNGSGVGDYDNEKFIGMMESLQTELKRLMEHDQSTTKIERERITLLKAKVILAQQGRAVEKFMSDTTDQSNDS